VFPWANWLDEQPESTVTEGSRPIGVDLFCGAGGMSLGFHDAGFDVRAAADILPQNVSSYRANFPRCGTLELDIRGLTGKRLRAETPLGNASVDVVLGGPPCQGFSIGGQRAVGDLRNTLMMEFARLVKELEPRYFVLENVSGLLTTGAATLQDFVAFVRRVGYEVVHPISQLEASDFGVPQRRQRVFILGWQRGCQIPRYPEPLTIPIPTVWDAISDLPRVEKWPYLLTSDRYLGSLGEPSAYAAELRQVPQDFINQEGSGLGGCLRTVHSAHVVERFKTTKPGHREPVSRFLRLNKRGQAPTLRAGSGRDWGAFTAPRPIHPTSNRCITVREAARLHSMPDWFSLHPTRWHGFSQVGNAVPPLLARAVAAEIMSAIQESTAERQRAS